MSKSMSPDPRYITHDMTSIRVGDVVRIGQGRIDYTVKRHWQGTSGTTTLVHLFDLAAVTTGRRRCHDVRDDASKGRVTLVRSLDEVVFGADVPAEVAPTDGDTGCVALRGPDIFEGKPARTVRVDPEVLPADITLTVTVSEAECVFLVNRYATPQRVLEALAEILRESDE